MRNIKQNFKMKNCNLNKLPTFPFLYKCLYISSPSDRKKVNFVLELKISNF